VFKPKNSNQKYNSTTQLFLLCGVSDVVYDTERKGNNNLLADITTFKESRA